MPVLRDMTRLHCIVCGLERTGDISPDVERCNRDTGETVAPSALPFVYDDSGRALAVCHRHSADERLTAWRLQDRGPGE